MKDVTKRNFGQMGAYKVPIRRPQSRFNVSIRAHAHWDAGRVSVTLHDISIAGAAFSSLVKFTIGQRIILVLGNDIRLQAIVIWNNERRIGCQFENPIPSYLFNRIE